jgi:hypothetical protein
MSEKPTTVAEAGGQVFKALRNFVELVQEEQLSKYHMIPLAAATNNEMPKKAVALKEVKVAKPVVVKKRPVEPPAPIVVEEVEEEDPVLEEEAAGEDLPPPVVKKPKKMREKFPANADCNGNVAADPPRACRGGPDANVLVEYDGQAVCKTCRNHIRRTLADLKKRGE